MKVVKEILDYGGRNFRKLVIPVDLKKLVVSHENFRQKVIPNVIIIKCNVLVSQRTIDQTLSDVYYFVFQSQTMPNTKIYSLS